jgi:hypothetical protein
MNTQKVSTRQHRAEIEWRRAGYGGKGGKPWPKLTGQEAVSAGRAFAGSFKLTSGNRSTWPSRGVFSVNPDQGWHDVIHDVSHALHRRKHPGARPHAEDQEVLEQLMVRHAVSKGWLDGSLRREPKPQAPKPSLKERREARRASALAKAEHRLKLAQAAVDRLKGKPPKRRRRKVTKVAKPMTASTAARKAKALAATYGVEIERESMPDGPTWWVIHPDFKEVEEGDPCEGDHFCTCWFEVLDKVEAYAKHFEPLKLAA